MTEAAPTTLADLRSEIDRIDAAMHGLLMERSSIIETLIAIKKTQVSGSAFRPGREADMMKRLALRHQGLLPLDTVESIWRIIIATFTYVQANYSVHADISGGDAPMRDSARFHFGFTVPYVPHEDARAVIRAVAESAGDLGIFRMDLGASAGVWWRDLIGEDKPKIIARLPFIERPDHPAGTPVYCIAKPLADAAMREIVLYAARVERWSETLRTGLAQHLAEVSASAADGSHLGLLVAAAGETSPEAIRGALEPAGLSEFTEIGSHAARFAFRSTRS
ncbi:chorismate mutase [Bosea rubneri]|uniref:chorismate mutase n=1 Tax=Bosea rubneri TaxID=3075434 RepID=A0ABU3S1W8_9HYPH|nr:chorismate mutase [Bosea sp. ZW T0_25]MDU0338783.1 chorismate mutase [Bosea sp. ZW T0_25]